MGQPVKLSDSLVLDARLCAEVAERSIAGQIEFWASLGRAVESVLRPKNVAALKKNALAVPLSECIRQIGTPEGKHRLEEVLKQRPFPHYEGVPDQPNWLLRIEADGTRRMGHFVGDDFVEVRP